MLYLSVFSHVSIFLMEQSFSSLSNLSSLLMPFSCFESSNGSDCLKNTLQILQHAKEFYNRPLETLSRLLCNYTNEHIVDWATTYIKTCITFTISILFLTLYFCPKWCFQISPCKNYFSYLEIISCFKDRNIFWSFFGTTLYNINKWNICLIILALCPNIIHCK